MSKAVRKGEFTGRHMLMIMIAFFGTIITVNVTMAVMASRSWTGMVVENTYVASQEFNTRAAEARAQEALGWSSDLQVVDGVVTWRLLDADSAALHPEGGVIRFRHPAFDAADIESVLEPRADGRLVAQVEPADGVWIVEIEAETGLDHPYRDTHRITLRDGGLQ